MYIIAYTCNNSGRRGQGKDVYTKKEAQEICDELNEEFPNITHYPTPYIVNEEPRTKKVSTGS
jgi:hypothetical protein